MALLVTLKCSSWVSGKLVLSAPYRLASVNVLLLEMLRWALPQPQYDLRRVEISNQTQDRAAECRALLPARGLTWYRWARRRSTSPSSRAIRVSRWTFLGSPSPSLLPLMPPSKDLPCSLVAGCWLGAAASCSGASANDRMTGSFLNCCRVLLSSGAFSSSCIPIMTIQPYISAGPVPCHKVLRQLHHRGIKRGCC